MKKRILLVAMLHVLLVLNSCSSDSADNSTPILEQPSEITTTAKITSFSKNSGEVGEAITMYGENFSDNVNDVEISFDGVPATIVSATLTEIVFKLPATEKLQPKLLLSIKNRTINNVVNNEFAGNIDISPSPSSGGFGWFYIDNSIIKDGVIKRIQIIDEKTVYYFMDNSTGGVVYRTLDGAKTWKEWARNPSGSGAFYATKNDNGWCHTLNNSAGNGLFRLPEGGEFPRGSNIWTEINSSYPGIFSAYVEDNLQKGTIVSQRGDVYTTSNGADFTSVYDTHFYDAGFDVKGRIYNGAEIDNNHIWAVGEKIVNETVYPFILFKNNETDGWKEHYLVNEPNSFVNEVSFADAANGFLLIRGGENSKIYRTVNGGETWTKVYTGEKFTKFAFKDGNTGWAAVGNKVYKTVDGANTWTLDYAHDQPIRAMAYKNNTIWAIATTTILKRYL